MVVMIPLWAVRLAARYPNSGVTMDSFRRVFATSGGIAYHNNCGQNMEVL
jgi:hypothetical protein